MTEGPAIISDYEAILTNSDVVAIVMDELDGMAAEGKSELFWFDADAGTGNVTLGSDEAICIIRQLDGEMLEIAARTGQIMAIECRDGEVTRCTVFFPMGQTAPNID